MVRAVRLSGLAETKAAMAEMKTATERALVRRVLLRAGQPLADEMARLAPSPGKYGTGYLEDHIDTGTRLSRRQAAMHRKQSEVEVFAGATRATEAVQQEFGNSHHAAQPFARPAWEAGQNKVLDDVVQGLKGEVDKAAQRAARKAARAKGRR
mgnify:CR=1 FL=1